MTASPQSPIIRLKEGAAALGLMLEEAAAQRLLDYLDAVIAANERLNLTRVTEREHAVLRHLVDSLAFGLHLSDPEAGSPPRRVLDLGTGGGFPGVPAALALPEGRVTLVEGRARKVKAVQELLDRLHIDNAEARWGRLSELLRAGDLPGAAFDLVLARAVAPLEELIKEAAPGLAPGGALLCWKSRQLGEDERRDGARRARAAGLRALPDIEYTSDRPSLLVRYLRPASPDGEKP